MNRWDTEVLENTKKGTNSALVDKCKYKKISKYIDQIKEISPGYLHYLWWHATEINGTKAEFLELVESVNGKSKVPYKPRSGIKIHHL